MTDIVIAVKGVARVLLTRGHAASVVNPWPRRVL